MENLRRALWGVVLGGIGALIPLTAGSAIGPPDYVSPILNAPFTSFGQCGWCFQNMCDPGDHDFWAPGSGIGPDRSYGEGTHGCEPGWCSEAHPEGGICASEEEDLEEQEVQNLWILASSGSPAEISLAAKELGDLVSFNANRQALQVVESCSGMVVLSIPLTRERAQALNN